MTTHTPGPWSIEKTRDHSASYRVMDEQEVTVALCYQQPEDTWKAKDNARLIAAAPELLEACQAFLDAENMIDDEYYRAIETAEGLATAAIAKAKGEK